jgi:hypothetical protein
MNGGKEPPRGSKAFFAAETRRKREKLGDNVSNESLLFSLFLCDLCGKAFISTRREYLLEECSRCPGLRARVRLHLVARVYRDLDAAVLLAAGISVVRRDRLQLALALRLDARRADAVSLEV